MYYTVLPKIAGGKLYSSNAARLAFLLFLILSIPIGAHHQFTEPVLAQGIKLYQAILTYGVALPSFLTAFTVAASLEYAGRKRGSKTWLGWMGKLPYFRSDNFLFSYLICGLILFIPGGLTGIVNASYSLNQVVHNTAWIPGHFHMTVAGPVFLGIIGMTLYLYGKLTGKDVKYKKLATIVPYMWMLGMAFFSHGLMAGGLMGEPRRTNMGLSYTDPSSPLFNPHYALTSSVTLVGGIVMTTAAVFYFISFFGTVFAKSTREGELELPVSEDLHEEKEVKAFMNMKPWVIITIIVIIASYTPAIINTLSTDRAIPVKAQYEPSGGANLLGGPNDTLFQK
jgi:cytochrome c oxidase subunit 1